MGADGEQKIGWNLSEDQHGHFGALFESAGRATIRLIKFTEPRDDDEGLYERVRRQLLDGLTVWLRNGWLDENDVLGTIVASKAPPAPRPPMPVAAAPARPAPTPRRQPVRAGRAWKLGDRVQAGGIIGTVMDVSDSSLLVVRTDAGGEAHIGRDAAQLVAPEPARAPRPKETAAALAVPAFTLPSRPSPESVQRLLQHLRALEEVGISKRAVQAELKRMAYQVGGWGDLVQASILREEERGKPNRQVLTTLRTLASSLVQVLRALQARTVTGTALAAAVDALTQAYPPSPAAPTPARPPTEMPAFEVAKEPSRGAAQRLIAHLRKVEKVGLD